jgi:hypothetical protein
MATFEFDGLVFQGSLNVASAPTPDRADVVPGASQRADWPHLFRFGTTSATPERLKIDAPEIRFNWVVKATGTNNKHDWEAGILQSISEASWAAHYSNGAELKYRVKPGPGLVRDGDSTAYVFLRGGHLLSQASTCGPNVYLARWTDSDSPPVTFITQFSGDPFNSQSPPPSGLEKLARTTGKVKFHAFLAVINNRTGPILTLAECHWDLTWEGSYEFESKTWTPNIDNMVTIQSQTDCPRLYPNPGDPAVSLPFRLEKAEIANQRNEVWTPEGWLPCKEGLPDRRDD